MVSIHFLVLNMEKNKDRLENIQHQLSLKGYIDLKQWITEICKK